MLTKIQSPTNKPISIPKNFDQELKNFNHQEANHHQNRGETPESEKYMTNSKKLSKKALLKELPLQKPEGLPKTISNTMSGGFTSPKGAINREKIVFSFNS